MRFASSVENPATRVGLGDGTSGTTNINTKDPRLWMTPQSEAAGSQYIYKSIFLRYTEAGGWGTYSRGEGVEVVYTPLTLLRKNKTTKVDVVASNFGGDPSNRVDLPASTNLVVNVQQVNSESIASSDKLYFKGTIDPAATATTKATATYECILIPQTVTTGNFTVSFNIGDKAYSWTSAADVKMESGKQYALALTLNDQLEKGYTVSDIKVSGNSTGYTGGTVQTGSTIQVTSYKAADSKFYALLTPTTNANATFLTLTVKKTDGGSTQELLVKGIPATEAGKSYTYTLAVGKNLAQVGSVTVEPWTDETAIPGGEAIPLVEVAPATHALPVPADL